MKFNYQARTEEGDVQAGTVEAASQEAALKVLQDYNLVVTYLEKAGGEPFYQRSVRFFERTTRKDIVLFSRELATMFKSEVSLIEALRTLAEENKNVGFKEKILKIGEAIEGGTSLSDALGLFPELFSSFYVSLVKSGEVSGQLSDVLEYLADHLEREYALIQRTTVMMIYPLFILITFFGVLIMMAIVVIPRLIDVMTAENQQLPLLTRIVIGFTDVIRRGILLILASVVFIVFFLRRSLKTPQGKKRFDDFYLTIPLVGNLLKLIYLARFAENLSTLISGGLPITKALEITADVVDNSRYKEIILEAREDVRRGEMISKALKRYPKFVPSFFNEMVLVGEKTGRLSETLLNVVRFYQREIEQGIEALLNTLEPVMIIFLAVVVGILVAAILLPIYQMGATPM
jgi:type IV pilus assembly protein PilC